MTPTLPPHRGVGQEPATSQVWCTQTEVVVIGAGLTALSAAYQLTLHGVRPVILSSRSGLLEPSIQGLGLAMPGQGEDPARLARAIGDREMAHFLRFSLEAIRLLTRLGETLSVEVLSTPAVTASRGPAEAADLEASVPLLKRQGIDATFLGPEELEAEVGPGLRNGLLWPEAALIDPVSFRAALARAAVERGAQLFLGVELREIREGERLVVSTDRGDLATELVIHAGGAESLPVAPFLRPLLLTARVQHLGAAPVSGGPKLPGAASSGYEFWRRGPAGELWLGGFRYLGEDLGMEFRDDGLEPRVTARQEAVVAQWCGGMLPPITHRWTRFIDIACDNVPLVGPIPGQPRQLLVTGFAGLDSTYGVLSAKSLVEEVLESDVEFPVPALFNPRRMM